MRRNKKEGSPVVAKPTLTVAQILAWADAHHQYTGEWPKEDSGTVRGSSEETWKGLRWALAKGCRGLPGGTTLPRLLAEHRGVRNLQGLPPLTVAQILAWADAHHQYTGEWPKGDSGTVRGSSEETWKGLNWALEKGSRGLPGGTTLPRLLAEHRGVRNVQGLPPLTVKQVLAWADEYHQRTGKWPQHQCGSIPGSHGETWNTVNHALMKGRRGLPGGGTLADLLAEQRGVRNVGNLPPLTVKQILAWADEHHQRTGRWPRSRSAGLVHGCLGETWRAVDAALEQGSRGLPDGSSLAKLLAEHRGVRSPRGLPPLTVEQIMAWADAHYRRRKSWPSQNSGRITSSGGETWRAVDSALRLGYRGLPGRSSLSKALDKHRAIAEAAMRLLE